MSSGKTFGLILFVGGMLLLLGYGLYQVVQDINGINIIVAVGSGTIILGIIVLIISIIFEQHNDMEERKKEIKKEDFEP